jgi:hypothetical protein
MSSVRDGGVLCTCRDMEVSMALKVLSEAHVEHFIEYGYVQLTEAFPREKALAAGREARGAQK